MKLSIFGTGTAGAAALAVGALVMAPSASAVAPTTATVQVNCGDWGSGQARLDARQDGTAAAVTFSTPVVWATHSFPADSMQTTLTLSDAHGAEVTFTGQSNPAWTLLGQAYNSGPLTGTVTPGEALEVKSLTSTYGTFTMHCTATSLQNPGPFVF
ncbi:hypothetical protein [Streptomyces sp. NPDC020983]|uniref:hypothetical protein n=1 Tax=Streptomyces sp. NPDC020983 TaxID=3365106 RepID=UPI0037B4CE79